MLEEIKDQIIYQNGWESHLQRELNLHNRFPYRLYDFAAKKMASEYRKKQLRGLSRQLPKRIYHTFRSAYCDFQIRRLADART